MIVWIDCEKAQPDKDGYYLVWIPADEEYGNDECFDVAFWDLKSKSWGGLNAFPQIEDDILPSHWAKVPTPQGESQWLKKEFCTIMI